MMTLADLPVVQQLSREEQLQLVAELWDHIAARSDDDRQPVTPKEESLLEERFAAHQAAPDHALSLEEFKHKLSNRL